MDWSSHCTTDTIKTMYVFPTTKSNGGGKIEASASYKASSTALTHSDVSCKKFKE